MVQPTLYQIVLRIISSPTFRNIILVILGFCLGEGSRLIRYYFRIYKLKHIIREELECILKQLPRKKKLCKR